MLNKTKYKIVSRQIVTTRTFYQRQHALQDSRIRAAVSLKKYYCRLGRVSLVNSYTHTHVIMSLGHRLCSPFVHCVFPENCSMQKKDQVSNDQRTEKICETEENKIDFGK